MFGKKKLLLSKMMFIQTLKIVTGVGFLVYFANVPMSRQPIYIYIYINRYRYLSISIYCIYVQADTYIYIYRYRHIHISTYIKGYNIKKARG